MGHLCPLSFNQPGPRQTFVRKKLGHRKIVEESSSLASDLTVWRCYKKVEFSLFWPKKIRIWAPTITTLTHVIGWCHTATSKVLVMQLWPWNWRFLAHKVGSLIDFTPHLFPLDSVFFFSLDVWDFTLDLWMNMIDRPQFGVRNECLWSALPFDATGITLDTVLSQKLCPQTPENT